MAVSKELIIEQIKRTAAENGGKPLGRLRFYTETGIKESDWLGIHWVRWNEAITEAGLEPNAFVTGYERDDLLEKYANLACEIGRLPVKGDLRIKARKEPGFPSESTFGSKFQLVKDLAAFCEQRSQYKAVTQMCAAYLRHEESIAVEERTNLSSYGFVYLIKSGRFYKIGYSNSAGRREYELAIQLPERAKTVHAIQTDDPPGIEAYWHNRFKDKRKNGEWFDLSTSDVSAFKRRKFM